MSQVSFVVAGRTLFLSPLFGRASVPLTPSATRMAISSRSYFLLLGPNSTSRQSKQHHNRAAAGPMIPAGARGREYHKRAETSSSASMRGRNSISSFDEFDTPQETCMQIVSRLCESCCRSCCRSCRRSCRRSCHDLNCCERLTKRASFMLLDRRGRGAGLADRRAEFHDVR